MLDSFCVSYAFVVITTLPDFTMASQREKFSLSAATTIVSYSCGLAEAQSLRACVFSLTEKRPPNIKKIVRGPW